MASYCRGSKCWIKRENSSAKHRHTSTRNFHHIETNPITLKNKYSYHSLRIPRHLTIQNKMSKLFLALRHFFLPFLYVFRHFVFAFFALALFDLSLVFFHFFFCHFRAVFWMNPFLLGLNDFNFLAFFFSFIFFWFRCRFFCWIFLLIWTFVERQTI